MNKEEIHNLLKIENDKTTIFTNKELKMIDDYINELEAYKYNMNRDYLRLEKENKILRENAKHNDKVVDKANWENQKLKKQLEEYKLITIDYQELEARNQELKEDISFCLHSIKQEMEMSTDSRTRKEMTTCYEILKEVE